MLKHLFITIAIFCCFLLPAEERLEFSYGDFDFSCNAGTGGNRILKWRSTLLSADNELSPFSLNVEGLKEDNVLLESWTWDGKKGELILNMKSGVLKFRELINFTKNGELARKMVFVSTAETPLKMRKLIFRWGIPADGEFFFPAADKGNGSIFDADYKGLLSSLKAPCELKHPNASNCPLLISDAKRTSLFISSGTDDVPETLIRRDASGTLSVEQILLSAGWLMPGKEQEVGTVYLRMSSESMGLASKSIIRDWYRDHGFKAPADRPDWIYDSVMYSFHPGGTVAGGVKELGGFKAAQKELLPELQKLGFNLLWVLPLEDQWIYNPRDYYKFMKGVGTPEEYKIMLDSARSRGMRILQDIVVHGGNPKASVLRGNSPFSLIIKEDGTALDYWCFDFMDPSWRKYMADVAAHYIKEYRLDGFRIDAVKGSKELNWLRKGFPETAAKNVPEEAWKKALEANGNQVPDLAYSRAGLAMRKGGLLMAQDIRNAAKKVNPESLTFGETSESVFINACDVIYDASMTHHTLLKLREDSLDKFAAGLNARFYEQSFSDPDGLIRMRCIGNHDSTDYLGFFGLSALKALHSLAFFTKGMPMIYHESEIYQTLWLKKLIEIRKALPELSRGDAVYGLSGLNADTVFSVMRSYKGLKALVLINFSNKDALVSVDSVAWGLKQSAVVKDLIKGEVCLDGSSFKMAPWETAVLAIRDSQTEIPNVEALYHGKRFIPVAATEEQTNETDGLLSFKTYAGNFVLNTKDGMLESYSFGKELLLEKTFIIDASGKNLDIQSVVFERSGKQFKFKVNCSDSSSHQLNWSFRNGTAELEMQSDLPGYRIVFPCKDIQRWQADCAEGMIDDFFVTRHSSGEAGALPRYRLKGTSVIWENQLMPLAPSHPELRLYNDRKELSFKFSDILYYAPGNIELHDRFAGKSGAFFAVMPSFKTTKPFPENSFGGSFRLLINGATLSPDLIPQKTGSYIDKNGIGIEHSSLEWKIKTASYSYNIRKCGGTLRAISSASGEKLMDESSFFIRKGFGRPNETRNRYGNPDADPETGTFIGMDGNTLKMNFYSQFRDNGVWPSIKPSVWAIISYSIEPSGTLHGEYKYMSEGAARFKEILLLFVAEFPSASSVRYYKNAKVLAEHRLSETDKSYALATEMPDSIGLVNAAGKEILRISSMKSSLPLSGQPESLCFEKRRMLCGVLDSKDTGLKAGEWYSFSFEVISPLQAKD